jgi:uncharacterized membrane protein (DUF485 family)
VELLSYLVTLGTKIFDLVSMNIKVVLAVLILVLNLIVGVVYSWTATSEGDKNA